MNICLYVIDGLNNYESIIKIDVYECAFPQRRFILYNMARCSRVATSDPFN